MKIANTRSYCFALKLSVAKLYCYILSSSPSPSPPLPPPLSCPHCMRTFAICLSKLALLTLLLYFYFYFHFILLCKNTMVLETQIPCGPQSFHRIGQYVYRLFLSTSLILLFLFCKVCLYLLLDLFPLQVLIFSLCFMHLMF